MLDQDLSKSLPHAISTHKAETSHASDDYEINLNEIISSSPSAGPYNKPLQRVGNLLQSQQSSELKESSKVQVDLSNSTKPKAEQGQTLTSSGFAGIAGSSFAKRSSPVKLHLAQAPTHQFKLKRQSSGIRRGLGTSGQQIKAKKPKL